MIGLIYLNYLKENLKMARMIDGFLPYKPTNYANCYFLVDIYIKRILSCNVTRYNRYQSLRHSPQTNSKCSHFPPTHEDFRIST